MEIESERDREREIGRKREGSFISAGNINNGQAVPFTRCCLVAHFCVLDSEILKS